MNNIETNNLETHLLECYVFVDDYLQSNPKVAGRRRSNNDDPDFTDAEIIVIALMQGRPLCRALPNRSGPREFYAAGCAPTASPALDPRPGLRHRRRSGQMFVDAENCLLVLKTEAGDRLWTHHGKRAHHGERGLRMQVERPGASL